MGSTTPGRSMTISDTSDDLRSRAEHFGPTRRFVALEARAAHWARSGGRARLAIYEFLRFGLKQAIACAFGGLMVGLLIVTHYVYPAQAPLARYDFLFLAALAIQALMLATRFESVAEAKVIAIYHVVGTLMEVFKTAHGSWEYPEASLLRIGGVPLFTGFMYAAIGSYMFRAWDLFDFRFTAHPPRWTVLALGAVIYANFYLHHYMPDLRLALFVATAVIFWRTRIHYRVHHRWHAMPLLVSALLAATFIWFAENVGSFSHAWLYPAQREHWVPVGLGKYGSWFLLQIVSYALVLLIRRPEPLTEAPIAASRERHHARLGRP